MKKSHKGGKVAKEIEQETARIPSDIFLWTATSAMASSLVIRMMKKDKLALFIGQWTAPVLIMGVYNTRNRSLDFRH